MLIACDKKEDRASLKRSQFVEEAQQFEQSLAAAAVERSLCGSKPSARWLSLACSLFKLCLSSTRNSICSSPGCGWSISAARPVAGRRSPSPKSGFRKALSSAAICWKCRRFTGANAYRAGFPGEEAPDIHQKSLLVGAEAVKKKSKHWPTLCFPIWRPTPPATGRPTISASCISANSPISSPAKYSRPGGGLSL